MPKTSTQASCWQLAKAFPGFNIGERFSKIVTAANFLRLLASIDKLRANVSARR
jgi:hypothetical protein